MNKKGYLLLGLAAFAGLSLTRSARADESPFGYIYTTDTLPRGKWEYEQWNTVRTGKAAGSYTAFDLRNEIEYGVTDKFSASLYLNSAYHHVHNVPDDEDPTANLPEQNSFDISGVSAEMKYRVLSPYKDPLGLMLYLEPELNVINPVTGETMVERAVEGKVILQKNFFEDRLVWAANFAAEPEWELKNDVREKELGFEMSTGLAYRLAGGWYGGLELRNHRQFADFKNQTHQASFLGPTVHYGNKDWWATLTVLPQISGRPTSIGFDSNGNEIADPSRNLADHEKLEIRFRFGINFG